MKQMVGVQHGNLSLFLMRRAQDTLDVAIISLLSRNQMIISPTEAFQGFMQKLLTL